MASVAETLARPRGKTRLSSSLLQAAPGRGTQVRDSSSHSCSGGQGPVASAAGEGPVGSQAIAGR